MYIVVDGIMYAESTFTLAKWRHRNLGTYSILMRPAISLVSYEPLCCLHTIAYLPTYLTKIGP